jgi:hypothetical protein
MISPIIIDYVVVIFICKRSYPLTGVMLSKWPVIRLVRKELIAPYMHTRRLKKLNIELISFGCFLR